METIFEARRRYARMKAYARNSQLARSGRTEPAVLATAPNRNTDQLANHVELTRRRERTTNSMHDWAAGIASFGTGITVIGDEAQGVSESIQNMTDTWATQGSLYLQQNWIQTTLNVSNPTDRPVLSWSGDYR